MVDARRNHSVPPHVLDRQRTGPGRHLSHPGYLDHRAGKRVGSRGRSPAHRRKWRRHQRRGREALRLQSADAEVSWRHRCGRNSGQGPACQPPGPRRTCPLATRAKASRSMTITLLGTGLLIRAIVERLQSVGHIVTVYNRTATKTLPLQACVITVVTRPEQAMAQADCVVLMLADAAAIRAVLLTLALLAVLRDKN